MQATSEEGPAVLEGIAVAPSPLSTGRVESGDLVAIVLAIAPDSGTSAASVWAMLSGVLSPLNKVITRNRARPAQAELK